MDSPGKITKECEVSVLKPGDPKPSFPLRKGDIVPIDKVEFFVFLRGPPEKISAKSIERFTNSLREKSALDDVRGKRSKDRIYQNNPTRKRE
ncbi:hypothetical protein CRG98_004002 [Punica granatum]|uniref:Uncharacterized protein n=1 Tax=Punica granatum TaxID=22663 RepID=A0A2I0L4G5_PUNGR|nr:hypothetical protein CRG98_004002 [Punica granatum]